KENKHKHHLCVLAKNLEGWKSLLWITSISNNYFYYRPRVDLQTIKKYANGNLIAFSGHLGSELANVLYDRATGTIYSDAEDRAIACVNKYIDTFGRENFFIEIQLIDKHNVQ